MKGKKILITGGNEGIGLATAKLLSYKGADIIITGRNSEKGYRAINEIVKFSKNDNVNFFPADFSSLKNVHSLANFVKGSFKKLDVLINNAGILMPQRKLTMEGNEYTFQVNYLSPFLLTQLLMPLLQKSWDGRVINVTSKAESSGKINFDDLMFNKGYNSFKAYAQSKLALLIFTYELARRVEGSGVKAYAVHPGMVKTNFENFTGLSKIFFSFTKPFLLTPEEGAETTVFVALEDSVKNMNGKYFIKSRPANSSKQSYNRALAEKLWEISEQLIKPVHDFSTENKN